MPTPEEIAKKKKEEKEKGFETKDYEYEKGKNDKGKDSYTIKDKKTGEVIGQVSSDEESGSFKDLEKAREEMTESRLRSLIRKLLFEIVGRK
jgi:hypothetical protein